MRYSKSDFQRAVDLYLEWNVRINVVSRKDTDMLFEHHFLHSLAIAEYLSTREEDTAGASFLDVGTGGGFPGIPLAMALPSSRFTLCDSIGKKIMVAREVASSLGLDNVTFVCGRAEALDGRFDYVVSRAVTSLDRLYPWVKGKFGRALLCLKGGDVAQELATLNSRFGLDASRQSVWPVSEWLDEEYFAEKFVIDIRK